MNVNDPLPGNLSSDYGGFRDQGFRDLINWEGQQQIYAGLIDGGDYDIETHKHLYAVLYYARTEIEQLRKEVKELREFKSALSALRQLMVAS